MYVIECSDPKEIEKLLRLSTSAKEVRLTLVTENPRFAAIIKRHYKNVKIKRIEEKS